MPTNLDTAKRFIFGDPDPSHEMVVDDRTQRGWPEGSDAEARKKFYPERTLVFQNFHPSWDKDGILFFVTLFGDANYVTFLKDGRVVVVYKHKESIFVAILWIPQVLLESEHKNEVLVDYLWNSAHSIFYEETFVEEDGEMVGYHKDMHLKLLHTITREQAREKLIWIGGLENVVVVTTDEGVIIAEAIFLYPLDAAIAAYCSFGDEFIYASIYGPLDVDHLSQWNSERRFFSAPSSPSEPNVWLFCSKFMRRMIKEIRPFKCPYPVTTQKLSVLIPELNCSYLLLDLVKRPEKFTFIVEIPAETYTALVYSVPLQSVFRTSSKQNQIENVAEETMEWIAYFNLEIDVIYQPRFAIGMKIRNRNYVFSLLHKSFLETDLSNFYFLVFTEGQLRCDAIVKNPIVVDDEDKLKLIDSDKTVIIDKPVFGLPRASASTSVLSIMIRHPDGLLELHNHDANS